jgi:SAM-dependent methyltransferase
MTVVEAPTTPESHLLWDLHQLAQARQLVDWQFEQFAPYAGGRVVEVGAGIGTFSERLLGAGVDELLLVEPEAPCANELEERFGAEPRVEIARELLPDAPSMKARAGTVDFIVCQNVLEHIADDQAAMSAMAATLAPGGMLSVLVPAHPALYSELDRTYGHERRYPMQRLRDLAATADLEVVDLYRFNLLGTIGWAANRWRRRAAISGRALRAYELLLPPFRAFERRRRPPWGLSLVLHARRR